MSTRAAMNQRAQQAREEIQSIRFQIESSQKTLAVLEFAEKVLTGEPKSDTPTGLVIHATQSSLWVDKADCTECGVTLQGYQKNWKFCPACGSAVVKVEKEDSPSDRLTRDAVKHAVDSLTLAGGK